MSFSSNVKDELSRQMPGARHCQIAETAAILSLCGRVKISASDRFWIEIHTENVAVARKYFTLLKKTFNIRTDVSIRSGMNHGRSRTYIVAVREHEEALKVLQAVKLINSQGEIGENLSLIRNVVLQNACCRRAFIRAPSWRPVPSAPRRSSTTLKSCVPPSQRRSSLRTSLPPLISRPK